MQAYKEGITECHMERFGDQLRQTKREKKDKEDLLLIHYFSTNPKKSYNSDMTGRMGFLFTSSIYIFLQQHSYVTF